MKRAFAVTFALLCVSAALAQAAEVVTSESSPELKPLLWMVGDWKAVHGTGKDATTVYLHARLAPNGQAILFDVEFSKDGKLVPRYTGMYYWHPAEKTFGLFQVSAEGAVLNGRFKQTGDTAEQLATVVTANGSMQLRSQYQIRPDSFHFVADFKTDKEEKWAPALDITYERVK